MLERPRGGGGGAKSLSIGALSRATEIPVETLRTWERRYGAPLPSRKPSGHRVYDPRTVDQLRLVRRLMSRGHRPGEILGLSARELGRLLALTESRDASSAQVSAEEVDGGASLDWGFRELFAAATEFDRTRLMGELRRKWVRLGPSRFLQEWAGAFMTEVGLAWKRGAIEIRHEHFASACLIDFLREVREPFDRQATGPRVVASTLPGDSHEVGILMASVLLSMRGFRVVYLGADTPIEQIAAAAGRGIDAVALSVSSAVSASRAEKAVARLRGALPRRMPLWVGGAGGPPPTKGVERFESLEALGSRLEKMGR